MSRYIPSFESKQIHTLETFERELGFKPDATLKGYLSKYGNTEHGSNEFYGLTSGHLNIITATKELRAQGLQKDAVPLLAIGDDHFYVYSAGKVGEWSAGKFIGNKKSYSVFISEMTAEASQEGFFSNVGKFLAGVGTSLSRSNAIASIDFNPDSRPEVNGVPCKDYTQLQTFLRNAISSGTAWDATLIGRQITTIDSGHKDAEGRSTYVDTYRYSVVVIVGIGNVIKVRLPGYRDEYASARIARLLIEDLGLKRVE